MNKPRRRGLPRYAIRLALVEIRGEVERYADRHPNIRSHICLACDRVASNMRLNGTVRDAARYIKRYVNYKLGGLASLESWQFARGLRRTPGDVSNEARIAWLTWMLEGIEREIEKKGRP